MAAVLQSWHGRLLSTAGKEIMVKAIAQAIPSYSMGVFQIPTSICKMLTKQVSSFWWSKQGRRGVAWKKWSVMCRLKAEGGLGFRDFQCFNQALLAKFAWRIHTEPDLLVSRLLKAKYFPSSEFLYARNTGSSSYVWRSITWGRSLLKKGLIRRIGDGKETSIVGDWWIPVMLNYKPLEAASIPPNMKVSHLITDHGGWDHSRLLEFFREEEIKVIQQIVPSQSRKDKEIWFHDKLGCYSVKSGYRVALSLNKKMQDQGSSSSTEATQLFWRKNWSCKVPPKVKHFLWKAIQNCLPTKEQLLIRRMDIVPLCHRCGKRLETTLHALWECKHSRALWRLTQFGSYMETEWTTFDGLVMHIQKQGNSDGLNMFAYCSWLLWHERNKTLYGEKTLKPEELLLKASEIKHELENMSNKVIKKPEQMPAVWQASRRGGLKLNVDGASDLGRYQSGFGAVLRDDSGQLVWAAMEQGLSYCSPFLSELKGLWLGLSNCLINGTYPTEVITDSIEVENCVNLRSLEWHPHASLIMEVKGLCSSMGVKSISHQPRSTNNVAHVLARKAAVTKTDGFWAVSGPPWLEDVLLSEMQVE